jgi:hypothetical protein
MIDALYGLIVWVVISAAIGVALAFVQALREGQGPKEFVKWWLVLWAIVFGLGALAWSVAQMGDLLHDVGMFGNDAG